MKKISLSVAVIGVVLLTTVGCTAVRTYDDGYNGGYYSSTPFFGSIDPFTGFYYYSAPYGYYPYVNGYYGGRAYGYNLPRRYRNSHSYAINQYGRTDRSYRQPARNYNQTQRNVNTFPQQQNRTESRNRIFGSPRR